MNVLLRIVLDLIFTAVIALVIQSLWAPGWLAAFIIAAVLVFVGELIWATSTGGGWADVDFDAGGGWD